MSALYHDRLVYLDTGEIFDADDDGFPIGDPVAVVQLAILDDDADALGRAMAAAPDLLAAASALDSLMSQREAELGGLSDEMAAIVSKNRAAIAKATGQ